MDLKKWCLPFLLVFCLLAGCAPASQPVAMFLGSPEHNNVSQSAPLTHEPEVKWKFATGGFVRSSPVIAGSLLYVGSNDGSLYALDVETGAKKWDFKTGGLVASTPAVAGGLVYFTSADGNLYALDAATGAKKWAFLYPEGFGDIYDLYLSSPTVVDGLVYFGGGEAKVYALDAATGKQVWIYETQKYDPQTLGYSISVHTSPTIANGILYTGDFNGNFVALDAKTGALIWKDEIRAPVHPSPVVVDGVVYYGGRTSKINAADAKIGKKIWQSIYTSSWFYSSYAITDGILYTGSGDVAGSMLYAFDAKTGTLVWSQPKAGWLFSTVLVAGDMIYIGDAPGVNENVPDGSGKGKLYAVDRKTGADVWQFETGGPIFSTALIQNGVVYFGSNDGNVYALK